VFVLGIALLVIAGLVSVVGSIMWVVAAFRVSTTWGLLVLLVPFAAFVFLFMYWQESKKAFLVSAAALGIAVLAGVTMAAGGISLMKRATEQALVDTPSQVQVVQPDSASESTPGAAPSDARQAAPVAPAPGPPVDAETAGDLREAQNIAPSDMPDFSGERHAEDAEPELPGATAVNLEEHIGEQLLVVEKSGRSVRGTLLSVSSDALRLERRISGGTVEYSVARANIRDVRTTR
jgi:hypothetical protein